MGKEGSEPLVAEPRADETTAGTATGRTALSPRHQGEGDDESASDEREAPANLGAVVDPEAAESFALSPLGRSLATAPPMAPAPCLPNSAVVAVATLMTRLARRIALGRERGAASLRVEIGEGTLSGAVLVVESRSGGLRIELELPPGTNGVEWKEKLSARLAERGLASAALSVH